VSVTVGDFPVASAEENQQDENSITVVYSHEGSTSADGLLKRGGFSAQVKSGPSHCTGDPARRIFRELRGERFVSFDLGDSYRF